MGYPPCGSDWASLGRLRRRGQKPADTVWITDNWRQRANLQMGGNFVLPLPLANEAPYVAGLEVILIADPGDAGEGAAQLLASANPRRFVTYFRGRGAEVVL